MTAAATTLTTLILLPWAALWLLGGIWLARAAFRLHPNEGFIVGIALGWLMQNWLANLLAQVIPAPAAFWTAAGIVFLGGGLAVALRQGWKALFGWAVSLPQLLVLVGLIYLSFSMGRGTAIFDDFQHLPTASVMATGDIPPHFVLDPKVVFGYHHFLLLFSAQLIRVGSLAPWLAADAGRAISFGLAIVLAALFAERITRSLVGGFLGGVVVAFASGTRWLLLILPPGLVAWLGRSIHLIGSGAGSGATLSEALVNSWAVEGAGPIAYPFAFANGVYPSGVIQTHNANGLTGFVVIFLLLLTFNRWRTGLGAVLSAVLISIWGLLGEAELPAVAAGWGIVALACILTNRTRPVVRRLPRALWVWLGVVAAGVLIGLLEGGAWTDLLLKTLARWSGSAAEFFLPDHWLPIRLAARAGFVSPGGSFRAGSSRSAGGSSRSRTAAADLSAAGCLGGQGLPPAALVRGRNRCHGFGDAAVGFRAVFRVNRRAQYSPSVYIHAAAGRVCRSTGLALDFSSFASHKNAGGLYRPDHDHQWLGHVWD